MNDVSEEAAGRRGERLKTLLEEFCFPVLRVSPAFLFYVCFALDSLRSPLSLFMFGTQLGVIILGLQRSIEGTKRESLTRMLEMVDEPSMEDARCIRSKPPDPTAAAPNNLTCSDHCIVER